MVREQVAARGIDEAEVLHAMRVVPRHLFVPIALRAKAYADRPLPIHTAPGGAVQTISQPYMVAAMTAALGVTAGDRVLEVGTGCGYQAAVLAEVASEVFSLEVLPDLAGEAADRLAALGYRNVEVRAGDGALGWPEQAPFDGILVACGATAVPPALLDQLAPGRRLVVPVGEPGQTMDLQLWTRDEGGSYRTRSLMPVRFVPLVRPAGA